MLEWNKGEDGYSRGKDTSLGGVILSGCSCGECGVVSELIPGMVSWLEDEAARRHLVILKVLSDSGEVNKSLDSKVRKDILVTYAGELQELRGIENTTRKNNFFSSFDGVSRAVVAVGYASCRVKTAALGAEIDLGCLSASEDDEVGFPGVWSVVCWCSV